MSGTIRVAGMGRAIGRVGMSRAVWIARMGRTVG